MKKRAVLLFAFFLMVSGAGVWAQEAEVAAASDAEPGPIDPAPVVPKECYGYTGSEPAGGSYTVSFCNTGHGCQREVGRAHNDICKQKHGAACAARTCPEGQTCIPIAMGGGAGTTLTNCAEYPDPNGCGLQGSTRCVCDATLARRLDCGCQCS
jgi:hypothetical protein